MLAAFARIVANISTFVLPTPSRNCLKAKKSITKGHAEDEHPVVGDGHLDHLQRLSEVDTSGDDGVLHGGHDQPRNP